MNYSILIIQVKHCHVCQANNKKVERERPELCPVPVVDKRAAKLHAYLALVRIRTYVELAAACHFTGKKIITDGHAH